MPNIVQKLKPKMLKAIDVYCSNPGLSIAELCRIIKSPYQTVYGWFQSPVFKEEIEKRFKEEWEVASKKAQKKMTKLIESQNAQISFQASKYVLDSCGFAAEQNINVNADVYNYSVDYGDEDEK